MEENKLQRASELIQVIWRIAKQVRINSNQCALLRTACFQVDVYIQVWSKDFASELKKRPEVVQELVHVLERCLKLVQSYVEEDWLRRVFISRENSMEFEGIVERLCNCTDLINQGLVYVNQRCEWKGEWIRKLKKNAMENLGFYKERLKLNAEQDRKALEERLNALIANFAIIKHLSAEDEQKKAAVEFLLSAKDKQTQAIVAFLPKGLVQEPQQESQVFNRRPGKEPIEQREPPQKKLFDMVFHRFIGGGTFGKVYEVTWLGQALAAKQTGADSLSLNREAEVMAKLQPCHPHVVQMIGLLEKPGGKFLIMELMETDLGQLITSRRSRSDADGSPFSLLTAIELMMQIAKGVSHLHDRGVVHRDLKPKNILLNSDGNNVHFEVKLADFGVSKPNFHSNQENTCLMGTRMYMAPEMLDVEIENRWGLYGRKVDVYSFAITCSVILSGKEPFWEQEEPPEDLSAQKDMVVRQGMRPKLPENCPKDLQDLISECWDGDPINRPCFDCISRRLNSIRYEHLLRHPYPPSAASSSCSPRPPAASSSSSPGPSPGPGIKNLCIVGKAVIGEELTATGGLETGVSTCICYWIRKYGDGTRLGPVQEMTRHGPKPSYTITADDYDTTIALECWPLAVTVYADDGRKVEYGPIGPDIELNFRNQHVRFQIVFEGHSFLTRYGKLVLNDTDYQLWWNLGSSKNIREEYTHDVSIALSAKDPLACLLTSRSGVVHGIKFNDARTRDVAVLTMRRFIEAYLARTD